MTTFQANIGNIYHSSGFQTIAVKLGESIGTLPLTPVNVSLPAGSQFMVTGADGRIGYFATIEEAWRFANEHGSYGSPNAIRVLAPINTKIPGWNLADIHDHATPFVLGGLDD